MNYLRFDKTVPMAILLFAGMCLGQDSLLISLKPNGHASMEVGQVVKGFDKNVGNIENVLTEKIYLGFGLDARLGPRTNFMGGIEDKTFNEFPRLVKLGATRRFYHYFYLTQAELAHTIADNPLWKLKIGGGYFPYKYNDDARNLGEYLFRSNTYPQTLTTEFDYPFARLAGLYAKGSYSTGSNKLNLDLLVTSNTEWVAIHDVNLSLLASYNLAKILEIGAGVSFCSIVSADESATMPQNSATAYDVVGKDTLNYTFRGTKLMARFSFDPKKLFQSDFFGNQDLKLYAEAAFLGVKNYPAALSSPIWYNSPLERIPVVAGFNWPTNPLVVYTGAVVPELFSYYFPEENLNNKELGTLLITAGAGIAAGAGTWFLEKLLTKKLRLDVLSVEAEWWGNRYPNSMEGVINEGLPIPFQSGVKEIDSTKYKNDNVKWSIYGSKTFAERYRITFQAASDHMRTFAWDWSRQDWEESLRDPHNWYYVLKFGVLF
jgi:hypothetical protein